MPRKDPKKLPPLASAKRAFGNRACHVSVAFDGASRYGVPAEKGVNNAAINDLNGAVVDRAYQLWAPVYDVIYGGILEEARQAAAEAGESVGGRILEIGIGTGLSLDYYKAAGIQLYGIDICAKMLAVARARAAAACYPHLKELKVMDAHELAYSDGFFDCTVAQFVITLAA
jgi:phosphatidylethanolamine/phosphatidyl-N-methylethanolamine N-methyltransferase